MTVCVVVTQVCICDFKDCKELTTHKHINECMKTGKISVRLMDYINVNFLLMILHYSFLRCRHHWDKLGEG